MEFEERINQLKKLSVVLETGKPTVTQKMKRAVIDTITVELMFRRKVIEYDVVGLEGYSK